MADRSTASLLARAVVDSFMKRGAFGTNFCCHCDRYEVVDEKVQHHPSCIVRVAEEVLAEEVRVQALARLTELEEEALALQARIDEIANLRQALSDVRWAADSRQGGA